jgi:hypothetical protein
VTKIEKAYLSFKVSIWWDNLHVVWDVSEEPATYSSSPILGIRRRSFGIQQSLHFRVVRKINLILATDICRTHLIRRLIAPTYLAEVSLGE